MENSNSVNWKLGMRHAFICLAAFIWGMIPSWPLMAIGPQGFHSVIARKKVGAGGAPTWIIEEYFEGTGTPSGWTVVTNSPDFDYATGPIEGAKSMRLLDDLTRAAKVVVSSGDRWMKCTFNLTNLTGTDVGKFYARSSSDVNLIKFETTSGTTATWNLSDSTDSDTADAVGQLSSGTAYDLWMHYEPNGLCWAAIATEGGVRPTSGDWYLSFTDTSGTALDHWVFYTWVGNSEYKVDKVFIDDEVID